MIQQNALASDFLAEPPRLADRERRTFSRAEVAAIWAKARPIPFHDPAVWRQDESGNVLHRKGYGQRGHPYGWEVGHIVPLESGGTNALDNLRPLKCSIVRRPAALLRVRQR